MKALLCQACVIFLLSTGVALAQVKTPVLASVLPSLQRLIAHAPFYYPALPSLDKLAVGEEVVAWQQYLATALGIDVTHVDSSGKTALHHSAQQGNLLISLMLVVAGADLRARDNDGKQPYDLAAAANRMAVASVLLEAMGSTTERGISSKDSKGWTPLNWAITDSDEPRVQELLDKKAKAGEGCQNALEICLVMENIPMFEMIMSVSGIDVGSSRGDTALMGVSRRGNEPAVDILLLYKASPNVADTKEGNTPLHLAAEKNYVSIVIKLLQHGALPNTRDQLGNPPVIRAARWGHTRSVQALHASGADINLRGSGGMTALIWTIFKRKPDTMQALLEMRADTSIVDDHGNSPLTWVVLRGEVELLKILLPYHDSASVAGQEDLARALFYALRDDEHEMAEMLLARITGVEE